MRRNFRKPLIVMSPKSLLRHKKCISSLDQMVEGSTFHRILWDYADEIGNLAPDKDIRRVVLCSGKVYYDLEEERDKRGLKDVYLMRVEQLYPFPFTALSKEMARFPNAEVVWCQEEPENAGAWYFIERRIERVLREMGHKPGTRPRYMGRPASASPATGSAKRHAMEQAKLVNEALTSPAETRKIARKSTVKKAAARKATAKKARAKKPAARK